ncbi:glycosyltransferase family 2 protein [Cellulomonas hominis]|nr:glycosyltransferase family A protein [Cellulomonas hominis]MBU5421290.1 glycosyltransferase family 2 protein [Cellulomonas hominis]
MPADAPQLSVGVPVYNGARYLEQALTALRDQDLDDIEVIVSDNASTDATPDIARAFVDADPRFRNVRAAVNQGVPRNFNRTLALARAPLFMWHAADDLVTPRHLVACRDALAAEPDADIAFPRVTLIGPDGEVVGYMDDEDLTLRGLGAAARVDLLLRRSGCQAIAWGGVHRTAALRALGGHPPFFGGDMVLGLRSALRTEWAAVPERLFLCRRHDSQNSKAVGADPVLQVRSFDPGFRRPVAFPQWYLAYRLLAEAAVAPASPAQRAGAVAAVLRRFALPEWRMLAFDVKRNLIRLRTGGYQGAYSASAGSWV